MKKIYLKPETKVMKVALSAIITASEPQVKVDTSAEAVDAGDVESRRYRNVWVDEEEEGEEF